MAKASREDPREGPPEKHDKLPGGQRDWTERHLWQIQPVRAVLVVVGLVAFFTLGAQASIVTVPLLLALLLAYLFDPLVRLLVRLPMLSRRSAAVAGVRPQISQ